MTPAAIIKRVTEDGVSMVLSHDGDIKVSGDKAKVSRWIPLIRQNKSEIVETLRDAANDPTHIAQEIFTFNPPGAPANDDEALQERVAIMMEGNYWDAPRALQEARDEADKERCWRGFIRNANQVLDAPAHQQDGLLAQYQAEAIRRYGKQTGAIMAEALTDWVKARKVH